MFELRLYSKESTENNEENWLWLNDSTQLWGIFVLDKYNNFIIDKHPDFNCLLRRQIIPGDVPN